MGAQRSDTPLPPRNLTRPISEFPSQSAGSAPDLVDRPLRQTPRQTSASSSKPSRRDWTSSVGVAPGRPEVRRFARSLPRRTPEATGTLGAKVFCGVCGPSSTSGSEASNSSASSSAGALCHHQRVRASRALGANTAREPGEGSTPDRPRIHPTAQDPARTGPRSAPDAPRVNPNQPQLDPRATPISPPPCRPRSTPGFCNESTRQIGTTSPTSATGSRHLAGSGLGELGVG